MDGKIIGRCRLCDSKKLIQIINFGKIPLGNNLLLKKKLSKKAKKYPLILNNCKLCNHFQLNYSVNPKVLYAKNYTYLSGTGKSMVVHLNTSIRRNPTELQRHSFLRMGSLEMTPCA